MNTYHQCCTNMCSNDIIGIMVDQKYQTNRQSTSAIRERNDGEGKWSVSRAQERGGAFPALDEVPSTEDHKSTAKNGFRIRAKPLPDLETLKELRERQDSVVDYRRVERRRRGCQYSRRS